MKGNSKIPERIFSGTHINWDRTKESIWKDLEEKIADSEPRVVQIRHPRIKLAVAAALAMMIGFTTLSLLYEKTIIIPAAQHGNLELPDGSLIRMNAESQLEYKPILFRFSRKLKFDGEAFFEVSSGNKFSVLTNSGNISVLGTSFNVYARKERYEVTCITGIIEVTTRLHGNPVVISPSQKAMLSAQGNILVESGVNTDHSVSWLENKLYFTSVSLYEVFHEIERQYDIRIQVPSGLDYSYTGTFKTDLPVEQILKMVCIPFDLSISHQSSNEYIISESETLSE